MTFKLSPELTLPILKDKFDSVFRRSEAADAIRQVYVYGLLWNLCTEFGDLEPDVAFAARCKGLARLFTARLEQAVAELKLIIPASAEAAYALAMAVSREDESGVYPLLTTIRQALPSTKERLISRSH